MRRPKRNLILITGIFLGVIIGLSLKATEYYLAKELIQILEEETGKSCLSCKFEVDKLKLSLLTLSATAKGARIREAGKTNLEFKNLKLTFDIHEILQKKIYLSRLDLIDGFSHGVTGKSTTYKFIKQLTKPPSPEKLKNPNRWKVKLIELRIRELAAVETIAGQKINFSGGELDMQRDNADDFVLRPRIKSIVFNDLLETGKGRGKVTILDQAVNFSDTSIARGKSSFNLAGNLVKLTDIFDFNSDYSIQASDYGLTDWEGKVVGKAQATGKVEDALIQGELELAKDSQLAINIPKLPKLNFDQFTSSYTFKHLEPNSSFQLDNLSLSNDNFKINIKDGLLYDRNGLMGNVNLQIEALQFDKYKLENITAKVALTGKVTNPNFQVTGQLRNLLINDFEFPDTNWEIARLDQEIKFDFKHFNPSNQGAMQVSGELTLPQDSEELSIQKLNYNFKNYTFQNKKFDRLQDFNLSGQGEIAGAAKLSELVGNGTLSLSTKFFAGESGLNGKIKLAAGIIDLNLLNQTNSLSAQLKYDLLNNTNSEFNLKLTDFQTSDYHPEYDCLKTTLETNYQFNPTNFSAGNGSLKISKLDVGCNQYALKLTAPNQIKIVEGMLANINLELNGNNSEVIIKGNASLDSSLNIDLNGDLELKALTLLTPWLSDLRGNLAANLNLRGTFAQPKVQGNAELSATEFTFANQDLNGKRFAGKVKLVDNLVKIESISGLINNSPVELEGEINPLQLASSELKLKYNNFKYEPSSDFYLETSGELRMTLDESRTPILTGLIRVNEAIFNKEIGIGTAINYLREYLFSKRKSNAVTRNLSELLLDIEIKASRNLFIISSLLEAELKGSLDISGTIDKPLVTGKVESLYGWVGLRNSRFDLIEAQVIISPNTPEPVVNVLADTNVINRIGEPVYISMEAHGPLLSPTVSFDSDSNLNQQDIRTLLTTRGLYRTRSQSSTTIRERIDDYQEIKKQGLIKDIFSALTDLDSISIEPAFNNRSGLIEPSLTRTRQLNNQLSLSSETFIAGSTNDTRFVANYDLTPRIRFTALADTATTQKNTALEFNTSLTLLSRNRKYLDTTFKGNLGISEEEILNHLRLNPSSRLNDADIADLTERLAKYYKSIGYFQAEVTLSCQSALKYCQNLELAIDSKEQFKISNIEIIGDALPEAIFNKLIETSGEAATQKLKREFTEELTSRLRSEGYLQARIDSKFSLSKEQPKAVLLVELELGQPVSFIFSGNKYFTVEDILEKTNLLKSRRLFGNNSVNILIKDIEKIYREAGYLFAVINTTQYPDKDNRLIIEISIIEEEPIQSISVTFNEIDPALLRSLKKKIKEYDVEFADNLFLPKTILDEELENNCFILKGILTELGYLNSDVSFGLKAITNLDYEIAYQFKIQPQVQLYSVMITGIPEALEVQSSEEKLSLERINSLEESIKTNLHRNGYLQAEVSKNFLATAKQYEISVQPGEPQMIGHVDCQQDREIECANILKIINLPKNQIASNKSLNAIKANLLKSGLFEEVTLELIPNNTNPTSQDLKIRNIEKQLTSLDLGFGVNSELGFHVFSEAVDRSLFKDGRSLGLRLDLYVDEATSEINQGVAGLRYQDPYFLDQDLKYSSDLGYQKFNNPTLEFELDRIILDQSILKSWRSISSTFGYSFLNEQLDNVTPGAVISELDQGELNLSYIYGSLNLDLRNISSHPDHGLFFGLDYKLASKSIESDASFSALMGRASWTAPILNSPLTLANNMAVGSAWTYDETPEIPISQRYYLGGRNSIRGFRENSLGPRGSDGAVIGGDLSISNNLELRYSLNQYLQLHSFYDLGNVFLDQSSISYSDLRESVGLGFRFKSPIGPIGLDFGHPLDRQDDESSWRVHFSVGSAF